MTTHTPGAIRAAWDIMDVRTKIRTRSGLLTETELAILIDRETGVAALLEAAEATSDVLRELSKLVQEGRFDAAEDYADANSGLTDLHVRSAIAQATGE